MNRKNIDTAIEAILLRLKTLQRKNGSWSDINFINALIATSLSVIRDTANKLATKNLSSKIAEKTARHILVCRSPEWTWNYLPQYPDDLDDTFCSLISLQKIKPKIINASVLDSVEHMLAKNESGTGAPYITWITDGSCEKWRDIDPGVNANIAYFLSLNAIHLYPLQRYIDQVILNRNYTSHYYDSPLFVMYFISRGYSGEERELLIQQVFEELRRTKNSTHYQLGICALLNLGASTKEIRPMIRRIPRRRNGGENLYREKITPTGILHARSEAFDMALQAEMYSLYSSRLAHEEKLRKFSLKIQNLVNTYTHSLDAEIREHVRKILLNNRSPAAQKIALLPFEIALHTIGCRFGNQEQKMILECCLISRYGWASYTIYDTFLDNKIPADFPALSLANIISREMYRLLFRIPRQDKIGCIEKLFASFDSAIYTEAIHKNNIEVESIINKSIGYMIPSILAFMLMYTGKDWSTETEKLILFFRHLIFVRQTSDDIRDWKQDIHHGIINRVTDQINQGKDNVLTQKILESALQEMSDHIHMAKETLRRMTSFTNIQFLLDLLTPYEITVEKVLRNAT